jgi:prepilin signal peptidase PulO-like enzyme (type II secretory pathway)
MEEDRSAEEERNFGWRQLPSRVNLRDFAAMVAGEASLIAGSTRTAFQALPHLPFGPLLFLGGMLMVIFRTSLLIVVVFVFGAAIALISLVRGLTGLFRRET